MYLTNKLKLKTHTMSNHLYRQVIRLAVVPSTITASRPGQPGAFTVTINILHFYGGLLLLDFVYLKVHPC